MAGKARPSHRGVGDRLDDGDGATVTDADTARVVREYDRLARDYDERWRRYLDASIDMTLPLLPPLGSARVLEVACGTGLVLERLAACDGAARLTGVDISRGMLEAAAARLGDRARLARADAHALPFESASFDTVVCVSSVHYFARPAAALGEMRRVLAPGGRLVVTDWCRDYFWCRVLDRLLPLLGRAHARTLGSDELAGLLESAGLRIDRRERGKIDWFWGLMSARAMKPHRELS